MFQVGAVESTAEARKCLKYEDIGHTHIFIAETMGAWGPEARDLIVAERQRLFEATPDRRSTSFLKQRVDIAIQRGNALSVLRTFPSGVTDLGLLFES